jgi:predicted metalloprotease
MRLDDQQESANVEDRRGMSPMMRGGGLGCGGLIVVLVISYFTGIDPRQLLQGVQDATPAPQQQQPTGGQAGGGHPQDALGHFSAQVLGSTERVWTDVFAKNNRRYTPPTMVLFSGAVQSACGQATAAVGPFYCPNDKKLYLDTSFFSELDRLGGSGDFARAYVIAHEVGHHVQNLLGIADKVQRAQDEARSDEEANKYSVHMELQADCLAGVWGNHAQQAGIIEPGDFEAGLKAASSIGDDRLQRQSRGYVTPESFTHGTSQQRTDSLRKGLQSGDPNACEF